MWRENTVIIDMKVLLDTKEEFRCPHLNIPMAMYVAVRWSAFFVHCHLKWALFYPRVFPFLSSTLVWRSQKSVELVHAQKSGPRESRLFYCFCFQRAVSAPVLQIDSWSCNLLDTSATAREAKGSKVLSSCCQSFIFYVSTFVEVRQQQRFLVAVGIWSLMTGQKMVFIRVLAWRLAEETCMWKTESL